MKGLQLVARRAILTTLKNSPVAALVPKAQIHGQAPLVPVGSEFIKLERPQTLPIKATCVDGGTVNYPLSAFAKARMQGGAIIESAEDHASRIGAAIERALDDRGLNLTHDGKPVRVTFRIADMLLQQDLDEATVFHYACTIRCRMIAE